MEKCGAKVEREWIDTGGKMKSRESGSGFEGNGGKLEESGGNNEATWREVEESGDKKWRDS